MSRKPLDTQVNTLNISLEPYDPKRIANLCGQLNEHLQHIENRLHIHINSRGNLFQLTGAYNAIQSAANILKKLFNETQAIPTLSPDDVHLAIQEHMMPKTSKTDVLPFKSHAKKTTDSTSTDRSSATLSGPKIVKPRGKHQAQYIHNIEQFDINFGIGPAGTGKTYLAVACAVAALENNTVERIILVRPAVEAGEKLGFLPGDANEKIDPYLKPLYDALFDILGQERVGRYLQKGMIEIAPLAYMRGRTLNNAFIILDEGQNTTCPQMKMFLTRLGFNSKVVITGDITQIDLPRGIPSGLVESLRVLKAIPGITFNEFTTSDIVRHALVQKIVDAYQQYENNGTQADTMTPSYKAPSHTIDRLTGLNNKKHTHPSQQATIDD